MAWTRSGHLPWFVMLNSLPMSAFVKVFGCRPLTDGAAQHGRPASENLQGRKPREGRRGRLVTHYGDLSAANAARD